MFRKTRLPSPNKGRGAARELPLPPAWTNATAEAVFRDLSRTPCLVDMYLVEEYPRPLCTAWPATPRGHHHDDDCAVCASLRRAYGDGPHVIAYRMWDDPAPGEDAEAYIVRHLAHAKQCLGGVPYRTRRNEQMRPVCLPRREAR